MKAFRSIRDEMRQAVIAATHPEHDPGAKPMQRQGDMPREDEDGAVDGWMQEAFEALVTASRTGEPFLLLPCTVNGEPTAAIVHVSHRDDHGRFHVTPLFVAMTPGMVLIDGKGRRAGDDPDG